MGKIREVKEEDEIDLIKKACEITDKAFEYILGEIKVGVSEIELANKLDFYMRSLGASGVSFETIVASGVRSAMPHGVASEKSIQKGELITFDFGCVYKGYVSDMTRTVAFGEVAPELKEIYQIVLEAQLKVIELAGPGVKISTLDNTARGWIEQHGYGKNFGHALGHGIGLELHETPFLSGRVDDVLVKGNIVTDEPGIYIEGLGGVRIEDDLLITDDGVEVLNKSPKHFIQL
jgi:Xaa-Pro aminopeptidase